MLRWICANAPSVASSRSQHHDHDVKETSQLSIMIDNHAKFCSRCVRVYRFLFIVSFCSSFPCVPGTPVQPLLGHRRITLITARERSYHPPPHTQNTHIHTHHMQTYAQNTAEIPQSVSRQKTPSTQPWMQQIPFVRIHRLCRQHWFGLGPAPK